MCVYYFPPESNHTDQDTNQRIIARLQNDNLRLKIEAETLRTQLADLQVSFMLVDLLFEFVIPTIERFLYRTWLSSTRGMFKNIDWLEESL